MGKDLYEKDERVRRLYDSAESILGFPLKMFSFEGPLEELTRTRVTQPAIFVLSCALDILLKDRGIAPIAAAGHSMGEYSALVSAGALTFEQGLKLVKLRGELMQRAGEIAPGTMAAVIGLEESVLREVCEQVEGVVVPANYNSPGQLVISGEVEAVERAMEAAKKRGAKLVKRLVVSGAFHSPLMETASEELYEALDDTEFKAPRFPVYANVTARPVETPVNIREALKKQLVSPVLWMESMNNMASVASRFLEVGPGKVLTGLMKRINRKVEMIPIGNWEAVAKIDMG